MGIPFPALCFVLVVNGLSRTILNAGDALFAVVFEIWLPVLMQIDVVYRANFLADATFHTGVGYIEMLIHMRGEVHKPLIGKLLEWFDSGICPIGCPVFNPPDYWL